MAPHTRFLTVPSYRVRHKSRSRVMPALIQTAIGLRTHISLSITSRYACALFDVAEGSSLVVEGPADAITDDLLASVRAGLSGILCAGP